MQNKTMCRRWARTRPWQVHVLTALLLLSGTVVADNFSDPPETVLQRAPELDPQAAAVAAEILRIQEQLGGSIVPATPLLDEPAAPRLLDVEPRRQVGVSSSESLREAAWELDLAARRLEVADLIGQADSIRRLSERLRGHARHLEAEKTRISAKAEKMDGRGSGCR